MRRLIYFLKGIIDDVRIIGATSLNAIYTWIDATYAVYIDMRSQTGGATSFGHGMLHVKSDKQKLNVNVP